MSENTDWDPMYPPDSDDLDAFDWSLMTPPDLEGQMSDEPPNAIDTRGISFELTDQMMTDDFYSTGHTDVFKSSFESPGGQSGSSCIDDPVWPHPEMELRCLREAYTQQLDYLRNLEARYSDCTELLYLQQQLVADLQERLLLTDCQKAAVGAQLEEMERRYAQMKEDMESYMPNIA